MKTIAGIASLSTAAAAGDHPYQQPPPWAEFAFSTEYVHRSKLFAVSKQDGFLDYLGTNDAADCPLNLKFECQPNDLPNCNSVPSNSTLHPDFDNADFGRDGCFCGLPLGTGHADEHYVVCAFGQTCDHDNRKCSGKPFTGGTIAGANPGRKYPHNTHDDKSRPSCNSDTENAGVACGYTGRFAGVHNFTEFTEGDSLSQQPASLSTQALTAEQAEWHRLWEAFPVNEYGEKILTDEEYAMMSSRKLWSEAVGCNNPEAGDHKANLGPMTRRQALERAAGWLGMGTIYADKGWAQAPCALETCGPSDDPTDCPRFSYLGVCQGYKDMAHRGISSGISAQKQLEVSKPPYKSGQRKVCRPADSVKRSGHVQLFRKWHLIDGIKYMEVWQMGGGYGKTNRRLQIWTPETHVVHCENRHTPFVEEDDWKSEWDYTVCHSTGKDVAQDLAKDLNISAESVKEMIRVDSRGDDRDHDPLPRFESCAPAPAPFSGGHSDRMCGSDEVYGHKHASADDCRSLCENDSKCNYWTFYGNSFFDELPFCEFSTTCTMELAPPNVVTYQSGSPSPTPTPGPAPPPTPPPTPTPGQCSFEEKDNTCFAGDNLNKVSVDSIEKCCEACQAQDGCTHFVFTEGAGTCGLKAGEPVGSTHTHCTSGIIQNSFLV